jgi:VIT1/CCC1 family predicted Fe2+/Mn2+ transporter
MLGHGGAEGASWAARQTEPWRGGGEEGTAGWARLLGGLFPFLSYFFISSSFYFEFSSSF